jgi:PhzF family phenazine biosynthesis protein
VKLYQIDAFTDTLFRGNPAAVVPLETWLSDEVMQRIAAENNLAETAFFVPESDFYRLRWFTPMNEVNFCGHATLASAFVLFNELGYSRSEIGFETRVGRLTVTRSGDAFQMDFPVLTPELASDVPAAVLEGLRVKPLEVIKNFENYFAVLESERAVREVEPDFARLATLHPFCVGVTARADETREDRADFVSRYFMPADGLDEDPVTGSIHATLAPYWAEKLGQNTLEARQVSSRGGELTCEVRGDRVLIRGHAVKYLEGEIFLGGSHA